VRDAADLDAVMNDGLLAAATSDTVVLIHSTVGRDACRAAAARLAERGARLLDVPVSGMRMAAEAGALTFFVGGPASVLRSVRHGLEAMGGAVIHVGDVGAGQVVKLANNLIAFATAGVVNEAVAVARAAGVDEQRLLEALGHGSARSWVVENWPFLRREWVASQPGGAAAVQAIVAKDLGLAVAAADAFAVDAPLAALAADRVPAVLADGR
jgi:3-hydroxyisobutyrate dehydrogenase